jgi:4-alpha-glucanotransferase
LKRSGGDSSEAAPALAPLQDVLNLGKEARMNVPGSAEGNWRWRCTEQMLSDPAFEWLRALTTTSNRSAELPLISSLSLERHSTRSHSR